MGEFASKLLDRIKLPFVVIILAIDLACAGIIFLPEKLREMLYLESFRRNFIQWIGPSFFILTLLLIMYVLLSVFKFVGNFLEAKKFEHAIDHTLENLSDAEMEAILKIYFSPNQVAMFDLVRFFKQVPKNFQMVFSTINCGCCREIIKRRV